MARPELANVPVVSAFPDIPHIYTTVPGISFIVDAIFLSLLLGLLLIPINIKVLRSKTYGRKVGAVLGIVLGLSSAFALRAAGITLFEYWLTTLVTAVLVGIWLFQKVDFILKGKHRWATIPLVLLLAWIIMDFWYVATGTETTRTVFGWISLLGPFIFVIALAVFLTKVLGRRREATAREGIAPPEEGRTLLGTIARGLVKGIAWPFKKGYLGRIARGLGKGIAWPFKKGYYVGKEVITGLLEKADEAKKKTEEAQKTSTATETELGKTEETAKKAATDLIGIAEEIEKLPPPTKTQDFVNKLNAILARIEELVKPVRRFKGQLTRVLNLRAKVEQAIQKHNELMQNASGMDLSGIGTRIARLPRSPKKTALQESFRQFQTQMNVIQRALGTLETKIQDLQKHLQLLQGERLQALYSDVLALITNIVRYVPAGRQILAKMVEKNLPPEMFERAAKDVTGYLDMLQGTLADCQRRWTETAEQAGYAKSVVQAISSDLRAWQRTYNKLIEKGILALTKSITALDKAIVAEEEISRAPPAEPKARVRAKEAERTIQKIVKVLREKGIPEPFDPQVMSAVANLAQAIIQREGMYAASGMLRKELERIGIPTWRAKDIIGAIYVEVMGGPPEIGKPVPPT